MPMKNLNINNASDTCAIGESKRKGIIQANNLSKYVDTSQGRLTILSSVNLCIEPGEVIAIVGASGAGKSTLLGLLAGLDIPSQGSIYLVGACITDLDEDGRARIRRQHVGFVFQSFQLLASLTAVENVMLPLELVGEKQAERKAKIFLDRVGLACRFDHYPNQLSGGEQQRVALARAFVTSPRILFADEPTGNLDSETGAQIIDLLYELNQEKGTTLVLVTHDDALASRCQKIIPLHAGCIIKV